MFYNPQTGAISETGGPGMVNIDLYVNQPDILGYNGMGIDSKGNLFSPTEDGQWVPTGKSTDPANWAQARQGYMQKVAGPQAAMFDKQQQQMEQGRQGYQDRYNAYQQAASSGVTGTGLTQVGTNTEQARNFLNTEAPGKAKVQSDGQPSTPANNIYATIAANNPDIIRTAKYEHPDWTDQQAIDDWWKNTPERNQFTDLNQVAANRNSMNWYLKVLGAHPEIIDALGGRAAHPDWNEVDFVTSWWNDANPTERSQFANIQQYADSLQNAPATRWSTGPGAGPERQAPAGSVNPSAPAGPTTSPTGPAATPTSPTTPTAPGTAPGTNPTAPTNPTVPTKPTTPSTTPGTNPTTGAGSGSGNGAGNGNQGPIARNFQDILAALGGSTNLSNLNDTEVSKYLPFGVDNAQASARAADLFGYDPTLNPLSSILRQSANDISGVAQDYLASTYGDADKAGTRNLAQETINSLGQGKTNYFNAEQGRGMLNNIFNMMQNHSAQGFNQQNLETKYGDFNNAFKGYLGAMGSGISPALLNNSNLMNAVLNNMKDKYNKVAPSGNYNPLGFIMGKY